MVLKTRVRRCECRSGNFSFRVEIAYSKPGALFPPPSIRSERDLGGLQEKSLAATSRVLGSSREAHVSFILHYVLILVSRVLLVNIWGEHPSTLSCGLGAEIPSYFGPGLAGSVHAAAALLWGRSCKQPAVGCIGAAGASYLACTSLRSCTYFNEPTIKY